MMPDRQVSRETLENHWRQELCEFRLRYDRAKLIAAEAVNAQTRWPLPEPDGSASVRHALNLEAAARDEYMRVLRIFTDLTVHGKIPQE